MIVLFLFFDDINDINASQEDFTAEVRPSQKQESSANTAEQFLKEHSTWMFQE